MKVKVFIFLFAVMAAMNSCRKDEVCKHEPQLCFTATPPTARALQWIFFDASCSEHTEVYTWSFSDGAIGGNDTITKRFSRPGTYTIQLIGNTQYCRFQAITKTIIITP